MPFELTCWETAQKRTRPGGTGLEGEKCPARQRSRIKWHLSTLVEPAEFRCARNSPWPNRRSYTTSARHHRPASASYAGSRRVVPRGVSRLGATPRCRERRTRRPEAVHRRRLGESQSGLPRSLFGGL